MAVRKHVVVEHVVAEARTVAEAYAVGMVHDVVVEVHAVDEEPVDEPVDVEYVVEAHIADGARAVDVLVHVTGLQNPQEASNESSW